MSAPWAWWLCLHRDTVSHRLHWDVRHIGVALDAHALASVEAHPEEIAWDNPPPSVVLIAGQHHTTHDDVTTIRDTLAHLERAVVIVTSDEASLFDWRQVHHPGLRWWISTPRKSAHGTMPESTRFFGEGSGPRIALPPVDKDLDVYFGGQITHARRRELADVLRPLQSETVVLEETPGFMGGRPRAGYLQMLARAKVAPCPSGAATVDSFRLYEVIETGGVPVVERRNPQGVDERTWEMMYPGPLPFPVLDSWAQLPDFLPYLLRDHARIGRECQAWWSGVKRSYVEWLADDLAWVAEASATVRP